MKISEKGTRLRILNNVASVVHTIELERLDGKKKTRKDKQCIAITHCPFCGIKA